jgi:hypothetical protein
MEIMTVPAARPEGVEAMLHSVSAEDLLFGNYVPTLLSSRYDAFIYIDKSTAMHPLHLEPNGHKVPETFPFEY